MKAPEPEMVQATNTAVSELNEQIELLSYYGRRFTFSSEARNYLALGGLNELESVKADIATLSQRLNEFLARCQK